jgi:hypothetical protein
VTPVEIDPGRPKGQHLSPEIGQQPMGQTIRWSLWVPVVLVIAATAFIVWAAGPPRSLGDDNSINLSDDSGAHLAVSIDGTAIGPIDPGFRGAILGAALRGHVPTITVATPRGTTLAVWSAEQGEHLIDLGTCGHVTLWVGSASPSLPPPPDSPPSATGCPT